MGSHRTVVRGEYFERALAVIEPDACRSDEFLDGVEWELCRNPRKGLQMTGSIWKIDTYPYSTVTPMTAYYTFDDDRVLLVDIEFTK